MVYTLTYTPAALDDLALVWVSAPDRQAVADASDRIDRELRVDPDLKGLPQEDHRVYADYPLAVAYEVIPDDRLVRVIGVSHL